MSGLIARYNNLVTINDPVRIRALQEQFFRLDQRAQEQCAIPNPGLGYIFLYDAPGEPNAVLEVVLNGNQKDSISTLYVANPLFSRERYIRERQELVDTICDFADAGEMGVTLKECPVRKRPVHVRDLGFMQLVDFIKSHAKRMTGQ